MTEELKKQGGLVDAAAADAADKTEIGRAHV